MDETGMALAPNIIWTKKVNYRQSGKKELLIVAM